MLGAPSARALASMCIALSIVVEYIWHYEEESEHNEISLTLTYSHSQSSPMNQNQSLKYPLCKKITLIVFAVIFSLLVGCSQFLLGFSSLDQVIFGWMLGAWLAFTYFTLVRKYVHNHVLGLMSGRTTSSNKMYYLVSTSAFLG